MKTEIDIDDEFLTDRINSFKCNGESSCVLKGSRTVARKAIQMEQDGPENELQNEEFYFDTAHNWYKCFKSLALWVGHPAISKLFRLFNMKVYTVCSDNIAILWRCLNDILPTVPRISNYMFQPQRFMIDEAGANLISIKKVFCEKWWRRKA